MMAGRRKNKVVFCFFFLKHEKSKHKISENKHGFFEKQVAESYIPYDTIYL